MKLRGIDLEIDFLEELEEFDIWDKHRVRENKFQCCSPFRNEAHPSFAVNLDNGVWIDSGAPDEEWRKGNFVTLLYWLREETPNETIDYLMEKYAPFNVDVDTLELDFDLQLEKEPPIILKESDFDYIGNHSDYLKNRGVSAEIQELFKTGEDSKGGFVSFSWFDINGNLVNVKHRAIKNKYFWYAEGQAIKYHVFGLNLIKARGIKKAFVVESEIDALYLWSHGFPAIALGRAGMSSTQRDLILRSGIEILVIATDNDKAGWRAGKQIIRDLNGYLLLETIDLAANAKDVNDLNSKELVATCNRSRNIIIRFLA
ncbi:toprim domain-containing protein [Alkalicoccobacillus gibsonii]|uniref:toprim domain-containing protein n=1 Tax=Alkalicoccobacillus gibsonii TaxID=79881 RepID=UPI003517155C